MKRAIYLLLLLLSFKFEALACVCEPDISSAFNSTTQFIAKDNVSVISENINSNLIPKIKENTEQLKQQNETLAKLIKAEQYKAMQYKRMLFLLYQKRSLHNTHN